MIETKISHLQSTEAGAQATAIPSICTQIDKSAIALAAIPEARDVMADLEITNYSSSFGSFANDPQALGHIFDSLDRYEATAEKSFLDDYFFTTAEGDALPVIQQLFREDHPGLRSLLSRYTKQVVNGQRQDGAVLEKMVDIVAPVLASPMSWKEKGQARSGRPDFIVELTEDPKFATLCFNYEARKINQIQDVEEQLNLARNVETRILEDVLGVSGELRSDFQSATAMRTLLEEPPFALDTRHNWPDAMRECIDNIQAIGLDNAQKLYKDFGIVNFDRYNHQQLSTMVRLHEGDEQLIAELSKNGFTVVLSDAFGDHNNAERQTNTKFADDNVLFFEIRTLQPVAFYRPLVMLAKKFGVKPSTLILHTHGSPGRMAFGGSKPGAFTLGLYNDKENHDYAVTDTQAARFLREYVKPDPQSGKRHIILRSCMQAKRVRRWLRWQSTSEALAGLMSRSDKVEVDAVSKSAAMSGVYRDKKGVPRASFNTGSKLEKYTSEALPTVTSRRGWLPRTVFSKKSIQVGKPSKI